MSYHSVVLNKNKFEIENFRSQDRVVKIRDILTKCRQIDELAVSKICDYFLFANIIYYICLSDDDRFCNVRPNKFYTNVNDAISDFWKSMSQIMLSEFDYNCESFYNDFGIRITDKELNNLNDNIAIELFMKNIDKLMNRYIFIIWKRF